tara:strand:- start:1082 stop:1534 length:453 start_codon:yes stop_codon:yes gene_type:complete
MRSFIRDFRESKRSKRNWAMGSITNAYDLAHEMQRYGQNLAVDVYCSSVDKLVRHLPSDYDSGIPGIKNHFRFNSSFTVASSQDHGKLFVRQVPDKIDWGLSIPVKDCGRDDTYFALLKGEFESLRGEIDAAGLKIKNINYGFNLRSILE